MFIGTHLYEIVSIPVILLLTSGRSKDVILDPDKLFLIRRYIKPGSGNVIVTNLVPDYFIKIKLVDRRQHYKIVIEIIEENDLGISI